MANLTRSSSDMALEAKFNNLKNNKTKYMDQHISQIIRLKNSETHDVNAPLHLIPSSLSPPLLLPPLPVLPSSSPDATGAKA